MNGIIPLGFPEASVGIAYFLNVVWLFIDCNLLSLCLLKIMFCQIISILANRIRETLQKISGTPQTLHILLVYQAARNLILAFDDLYQWRTHIEHRAPYYRILAHAFSWFFFFSFLFPCQK